MPILYVSSILRIDYCPVVPVVFPSNMGEVTELVPVPAFKAVVTVREHGEVRSIRMLSRQFFP